MSFTPPKEDPEARPIIASLKAIVGEMEAVYAPTQGGGKLSVARKKKMEALLKSGRAVLERVVDNADLDVLESIVSAQTVRRAAHSLL